MTLAWHTSVRLLVAQSGALLVGHGPNPQLLTCQSQDLFCSFQPQEEQGCLGRTTARQEGKSLGCMVHFMAREYFMAR